MPKLGDGWFTFVWKEASCCPFAVGQFSPRIVRALLQDRASQLAYGLFASTFTFALLALREVGAVGGGTVPGLTVLVA